jgi:hypothetical protein
MSHKSTLVKNTYKLVESGVQKVLMRNLMRPVICWIKPITSAMNNLIRSLPHYWLDLLLISVGKWFYQILQFQYERKKIKIVNW